MFIQTFTYVTLWSCELRHFTPLYVSTYNGMTIKLQRGLKASETKYPQVTNGPK